MTFFRTLRGHFVSVTVALAVLCSLIPTPVNAQAAKQPPIRLLVKVRTSLAKDIELALPLAGAMALTPGQSGNAQVEAFLSRHSVRRVAPLYPDIVRLKKEQGLSDLEIANRTRQKFATRANRLRGAFQPPEISRTYLLEVDTLRGKLTKILSDLKADPKVEFAEEDRIASANITPNDPYLSSTGSWGQSYPDLWGIQKIGAPAAWNTSTGAGIIVAVVDTGIDYNHPDIAANVWINTGEIPNNGIDDDHNGYIDDVRGWDFIGSTYTNPQQSNDPIDHNGHGTHVAGTVAAVGNNGIGVIGVAWNAQVMAVKGLDDTGTGVDSTLDPAILYAVNNGADIISASWGGTTYSQAEADAITYAYDLGAVIVVAAGNNAADARTFYPAALWNVITVAASDPNDNLASFSNYGSKIDVAAPGVDILSLQASGTSLGPVVSPGYIRLSGTSMATPHVSGLAALILSQNPNYSNEQVRQVIRASATDLGPPGYDLSFGYGRINASAALGVTNPLEAKISSPIDGSVVDGLLTISGVAQGAGFLSYTLDYGAGALPTAWTTIQTGNAPVSGTLGTLDTTTLANGLYDVRLTAYNSSGQAFVDRIQIVAHTIFILSPIPPPSPSSSTTFKNGVVIPVTGSAVGSTFQSFQVDWAPGLDPSMGYQTTGITLAGGGLSPVTNGVLTNWDTSSIIGPGYYTIRLTLNSSQLPPQYALTMVYLEPDLLSSNWPQFVSQGPPLGAGVVPALNSDGTLRLLLEGPQGPFAGASEFWSFAINGPVQQTPQPGAGGFMQPSVANFLGGNGEQAAIIDFSNLEMINEDGALNILSTNPNVWYVGSQTVVEDLAGDNNWEILGYGIDYNHQLTDVSAWKPDGTQLNTNFPIQFTFKNAADGRLDRNPVLVGDINGDGRKEIVAMQDLSPTTFTLVLFANDGSPLTWKVPVLSGVLAVMAAADLDNNGKLETIVAANTNTQTFLHVFQSDGTERSGWPLTLLNSNAASQPHLAVGDLNQDGNKEIVFANEGFLDVLKSDGTPFSSAWPINAGTGSSFGYNAVVIGDVDGDGFPEIVTVFNTLQNTPDPFFSVPTFIDDKLVAIRRDGTISKSWELNASNGCLIQFYPAPSIGDFNQDGITDIAVAQSVSGGSACTTKTSAGIVTVLSTGSPFNAALNDWPLVRHDTRNTSVLPSSIPPIPIPALSIAKTHVGNFTVAQQNAAYTVTVSNAASAIATTGTVIVTETVPSGLTLVSMVGTGWTCLTNSTTCTRSDPLNAGSSYPAITVTVNVAANASSPQVNQVSVSGGGSFTATISDPTTINPPPSQLSIAKSHSGNFAQGQQNAPYMVKVSNAAGAAPTTGTVTVTETVPSGMTLVSMAGTGWTCPAGGTTCSRSSALAGGASYPIITVKVDVAVDASSPQVNQVSVSGGGSPPASASDSTTVTTTPLPVLSINKKHTGNFVQGQQNATYKVTVSNLAGSHATNGTVTVTEAVPSGMTLVLMAGTGWTCPAGGPTCSRSSVLGTGASYPPITVTVNVAPDASSPQVNQASVSGGNSAPATASDSTTIISPPTLSISKTHTGNFAQGQQNATYTVKVSNAAGVGTTTGTVTVLEVVPSGLSLVSMAGTGWTCPSGGTTCSRSSALAGGASYPPITVKVNVAPDASSPQLNQVSVSGGDSAPASASDSTTILPPPTLSISKTHTGNFAQGQQRAIYTVKVSNAAGVSATSGAVTVTEAVPSGMTLVSMAGTGWTCPANGTTCSRTSALSAGSSYPPITVAVNVAADAGSPQLNQVSVSGGGSAPANASDSTTITSGGN